MVNPEQACTFSDMTWDWLKKNRRNNATAAMSPKTMEVQDKRTNQNTGLVKVQDYSKSSKIYSAFRHLLNGGRNRQFEANFLPY